METTCTKGSNGWRAETFIKYDCGWQLEIVTERRPISAAGDAQSGSYVLYSSARAVRKDLKNGLMEFVYGLAGAGDFSIGVTQSAQTYRRVTEKQVRSRHEQALCYLREVKMRAAKYYASPSMQWRDGASEFAQALWEELGAEEAKAA